MRIFLVRHADADAEIPEGLGDEGRALTHKARGAVLSHFQALAPRMPDVSLILTSHLVRAVQTAQLLATALHFDGPLKATKNLSPEMPVGALESMLQAHVGETVVLVGHQPTMGAMAAHVLGLPHLPKPVNPGTVIGLDSGRLIFYASPGQDVIEHLE